MPLTLLFPPSLGALKANVRAELLERSLEQALGEAVVVEVAPTYVELSTRLLAGSVEMAWAPPGVLAQVEGTARAILRAVRKGRSTYRSMLVGRREEALTVQQLPGLRAAWVDPLSTGGHLLCTRHLRGLGLEPDVLFREQSFRGSYREALAAVLSGEADVAPSSTPSDEEAVIQAALAVHLGGAGKRLAPIFFTAETPNDGLVLSSKLGEKQARELLEKLFPVTKAQLLERCPTLLLEVFEADDLVLAEKGSYAAAAPGR